MVKDDTALNHNEMRFAVRGAAEELHWELQRLANIPGKLMDSPVDLMPLAAKIVASYLRRSYRLPEARVLEAADIRSANASAGADINKVAGVADNP